MTLHLLIIWTLTWVLVPSDTSSIFLWVVVAKAVLFIGPLHINTARKVAATHLMWQLQPLLGHLTSPSLPRVCGTRPRYQCSLGWVLLVGRVHVWATPVTSEETFLLGLPFKCLHAHKNWAGSPFGTHVFLSDVVDLPVWGPRPIVWFWAFAPTKLFGTLVINFHLK